MKFSEIVDQARALLQAQGARLRIGRSSASLRWMRRQLEDLKDELIR